MTANARGEAICAPKSLRDGPVAALNAVGFGAPPAEVNVLAIRFVFSASASVAGRSRQGSAASVVEHGLREVLHPGPEVDGARSPCGSPINITIVDIPQLRSAHERIEVRREKDSETL